MAAITPEQFAERVLGLQLCFFEVLWGAERGLTHISGRVTDGCLELHFTPSLPAENQAVCIRLGSEVVEAAFKGQHPAVTFGAVQKGEGWHTLMSQEVFKTLAEEVAPWRLQQGR